MDGSFERHLVGQEFLERRGPKAMCQYNLIPTGQEIESLE